MDSIVPLIPLWYGLLTMGSLLSMVIAYPTVALFVTRPIQRKLRLKQQDYISDWVVWPFQSGFYVMVILIPLERWRNERNRHLVDQLLPVRQAATPLQWWLALWLEVSMCGMVVLLFFAIVLELLGVWSLGRG